MSYRFYSFRDRTQQSLEQWAERTIEGEVQSCYTRTLVKIFKTFLTGSDLKILEAGCGLGGWVQYFLDKGHRVIGVEYESEVVKRVKGSDSSFPIVQGDVRRLEFLDNSFDAYISLGVIEHFEEGPQKVLSEAKRVLKPGGVAFITVPYLNLFRRICVHPMREIFFFLRRMRGRKDYFWEYRYTKKELARFLEDEGFELLYTGIDDYIPEDRTHHIGLYADFFFLRRKGGEIWELNYPGRLLLRIGRFFSPWLFCSGLHMVARSVK